MCEKLFQGLRHVGKKGEIIQSIDFCVVHGKFRGNITIKTIVTINMIGKSIETRLKILPILTRKQYTSLLHWV
jgi:hypothetical protein